MGTLEPTFAISLLVLPTFSQNSYMYEQLKFDCVFVWTISSHILSWPETRPELNFNSSQKSSGLFAVCIYLIYRSIKDGHYRFC